jgi:predicted nucleic acid-binding protein
MKSIELDKEIMVFTTEANVYEVVSGIQQKQNKEKVLHDVELLLSRLTVLPLDHKAAIKAGQISGALLHSGKMIDDIDCLTAGIVLTNGCNTIVTRNAKHFGRIAELKVETY